MQLVGNCLPFVNNNMFQQIDIVKDSYKKTGDYQINAILYKKKADNKLMKNLREANETFKKKYKDYKDKEGQMETYFNHLINKIDNKQAISKSDDSNMLHFIKEFDSSLNGLEIAKQEIYNKIEIYQNCNNKALQYLQINPNYELIINYCISIIDSYKRSLDSDKFSNL